MPIKKIGLMLNDLGNSQVALQAIFEVNEMLRKRVDVCPTFFYLDLVPMIIPPLCAVCQCAEAICYDGPVIATSVSTAVRLSNLPGSPKKFFYCYDLEWIKPQPTNYEEMARVYLDPKLSLIARGEDHAKLIENCWNRTPVGVVEDFDIDRLLAIAY